MNIVNFNEHLLGYIVNFLGMNEMYSFIETCKTFYILIKYFLKIEINQPQIKYIISSKELLLWAKCHSDFKYSYKYTECAAKLDDINMLKYLVKDGCKINNNATIEVVRNNNFELLKYCVKKNLFNSETLSHAAANNNVKMMKYLIKKNCEFYYKTFNIAAMFGSFDSAKFLIDNNCMLRYDVYDYAVSGGNLRLLKYLYLYTACDLSKPHFTQNTMQIAIEKGFFKIVKWLIGKRCYMDHYCTNKAFANNDVLCLKYLIDNKCPITINLFTNLSNFGLNYNIQDVIIV